MTRPVSMRLRPQPILIVAAFALGLILPWKAIPAGESATHPSAPAMQPASRPSVEQAAQQQLARTVAAQKRLAPAVARAGTIARNVERLYRLPDGSRLPFGEISTTLAVATLELSGPAGSSSIPAENGLYVPLCGHGARRHCALGASVRPSDALVARRQALAFALLVFRETPVDLVVTALPQSDTEYVLLVFQRDLLDATEPNVDRETRDRFFAMTGLAAAGVEDSLLLAQLPSLPRGR